MKTDFPKLHFEVPFGERLAFEAKARGYLGGVTVELADESMHPVFFYDIVRLGQDIEEERRLGRPFVAEQGMIVVTEITMENMAHAVRSLEKNGFFPAGKRCE